MATGKKIMGTFVFLALLCTLAKAQTHAQAAAQQFKLDLKSSKIYWKGPKSVGHKHQGTIHFLTGTLLEVANKFTTASFVIDMNSIRTEDDAPEKENEKVNKKLKGGEYFWTEKYPLGKMQVTKIESLGSGSKYTVSGQLTLKGITKPIRFVSNLKKNGQTITATADFQIDRNLWGINSKESGNAFAFVKDKLIADEIPISLHLIFTKNL